MIEFSPLIQLPSDNYGGVVKKKEYHNDIIICFDIETTSAFLKNGTVYPYTKQLNAITDKNGKDGEFYRNCEPISLCYLWQCLIADIVVYGRRLEDFCALIDMIDGKYKGRKYIYVHNLGFEFCFLKNIFKFENVFAREKYKPMKAVIVGHNVEFRCSYLLTRLSLEAWGKKIGIEKKVGQLNYDLVRTPLTPLTLTELDYGEYDVLIMGKGLQEYLKKYEHIVNIPLTHTGEVRKVVKNLFKNDMTHHYRCTRNLPKTYNEYIDLVSVFRGGDTHANYTHVGEIITDVTSFDIASSYPWQMVSQAYPMGEWVDVDKVGNREHYLYRFTIELYGVDSTFKCHYIPSSKLDDYDEITTDNGRIMSADYLRMNVTDIDFDIIQKIYSYKKIKITNVKRCIKKYLPKEFVLFILQLYKDKTELKNVVGKEALYANSKEFINALYGMCVTALVPDEIIYNGEWEKNKLNAKIFETKIEDLKSKPYKNFLQYDWGVYVTAYARKQLWDMIFLIGDADVIYYDTDSVKVIGNHSNEITTINAEIKKRAQLIADQRGIKIGMFNPIGPDGRVYPIGNWTYDGHYDRFKTLGAKRYAYEVNGELHITASGINGETAVKEVISLDRFNDNLIISAENSGKKIKHISSNQPYVTFPDGFISNYRHGMNIRKVSYNLSLSADFEELVRLYREKQILVD